MCRIYHVGQPDKVNAQPKRTAALGACEHCGCAALWALGVAHYEPRLVSAMKFALQFNCLAWGLMAERERVH